MIIIYMYVFMFYSESFFIIFIFILQSEVISRKRTGTSLVERTVGKAVVESVSRSDKDVLLLVYAPWCVNCKKLMPTMDILAKAVAAEDRISIVKIDGTANDIPLSWNAKSFPMLLWFPAKDKPYSERGPLPRSYWDAGNSLMDLVSFIQRHSSFDPKSLRIATSEQLGSLLGDEVILREKYEAEDRHQQRNEDREVFENEAIDWLLGEVVFDGRRWHIVVVAIQLIIILILLGYIVNTAIALEGMKKSKKKLA